MLPKRPWQHQAEAQAFALLETKLPGSWILRKMTERDYGLDCLLEIVDEQGMLVGQSAWIQLKAKRRIRWNKQGKWRMGDIKRSTTNYWRTNNGPVFIVLVDLEQNEVYFLCTEYFIKRHFNQYLQNEHFAYYFDRTHNRLDSPGGLDLFALHLEKQAARRHFESELTVFLTNAERFAWTIEYPVVTDRYWVETMQRNVAFLCNYFHLNPLPRHFYEILINRNRPMKDRELFWLARSFYNKQQEILYCIDALLKEELSYWSVSNGGMYYYVYSLTRNLMRRV